MSGSGAAPSRPRVLVVEDIEVNRDLLEQLLEDRYEVSCAEDGETGLRLVRSWRPHLVLLDLSLPVKDGWTVAAEIRADPDLDGIRVVALTAHAMAGDRQEALDAGCDDYLTKPVDETKLLAAVARYTASADLP